MPVRSRLGERDDFATDVPLVRACGHSTGRVRLVMCVDNDARNTNSAGHSLAFAVSLTRYSRAGLAHPGVARAALPASVRRLLGQGPIAGCVLLRKSLLFKKVMRLNYI